MADKVKIIHDGTPVRLLEDEVELWSGTLVELERTNGFDDAECAHVRSDLLRFGRWMCGGGASPLNVIETTGPFALLAITTHGRELRRFEHASHAVAVATLASVAAPTSTVLVITDLDSGCAIWNYAPEPYLHLRPHRSAA